MTDKHAPGKWYAISVPHGYPDGTTHYWAVRYQTTDGLTIEIADWLDEKTAREISATHDMLGLLQFILDGIERKKIKDASIVQKAPPGSTEADVTSLSAMVRVAIAKATGAGS